MQYAGAGATSGGASQTSVPPSGPRPTPGGSQHSLHSAYAASALQAAQWSASSYAGQQQQAATPGISQTSPPPQQPVAAVGAGVGPPVKSTWPLNFETNGASYVFQAQSGVFYDASQRYYYCPKSKLYYNEVNGVYLYTAPPGSSHPYLEFDPPEPTTQPSEEKTESSAAAVS